MALPGHMDASDAGQIREELLPVINGGATALIADMTATIWCDHAGADAMVRAFQRAVISGTELRRVGTAEHVSLAFSLTGLDRLVPIYPSLEAATAASLPTGCFPWWPGWAGWQQIRGGKRRRVWAIATFVSGSAAHARRAGRWSTFCVETPGSGDPARDGAPFAADRASGWWRPVSDRFGGRAGGLRQDDVVVAVGRANGQAFAWVSVDEADNDPKVLLTYVAEALDGVEPIDERVFDALASAAARCLARSSLGSHPPSRR